MPRLLVAIRDSMASRSALSRSWKRRMSCEFNLSRPPVLHPSHGRGFKDSAGLATEIGFLHLRISSKGGPGTAKQDAAGLYNVGPIRDLQRAQRVLLDQQDRDALLVDALDDLEYRVHHLRRQP